MSESPQGSLTPERYAQLRSLFAQAMEVGETARPAFVEEVCGRDLALRSQLEALLVSSVPLRTRDLVQAAWGEAGLDLGELPRAFGAYTLESEIGRGGMGVVFAAFDPRLGRRVAVKILDLPALADEGAQEALRQEARNLAALAHPHIATIHSLEEIEGYLCATLELIDGVSLAGRLAAGALPAVTCLRVARQLCQALEAAHAAGIVHLDLKPANAMLTADGRVKVLDFGLAQRLRPGEESGATGGTVGYMSPEQVMGAAVDERADLWALGCVLFECLTGQRAIRGRTRADLIDATLEGEPAWERLPAEITDDVRELLTQCLARDPEERPRSATEIGRTLDACIGASLSGIRHRERAEAAERALPVFGRELLGRDALVAEVGSLLAERRLVTLTGAGGCGKTHLALEVARSLAATCRDGVCWVELAATQTEAGVLERLAEAVGARPGAEGLEAKVLATLGRRELVCVLDNAEHLVREVARIAKLVRVKCPGVQVLVTSREELGVTAERAVVVPPLAVPESAQASVAEAMGLPAVQLFAQCAEPHGFELDEGNALEVAAIVRRLDGIPLAIELAAGRTRLLSLAELMERLEDRFRLLSGGDRLAHRRQQTLAATLDWSHDLLDESERILFRRLAVFAGSWTLRAAEVVCAGDGLESWEVLDLLASLVTKSLVTVRPEGAEEPRYHFLETVREYARLKLEQGEGVAAPLRDRWRQQACTEASRCPERLGSSERKRWSHHYEAEHQNLLTALDPSHRTQLEVIARAVVDLSAFWRMRGYFARGSQVLADTFGPADARSLEPRLLAEGLQAWGDLVGKVGRYQQALELMEQAEALLRECGEGHRVGTLLASQARCRRALGDHERARALLELAIELHRTHDDELGLIASLGHLGVLEREAGRREQAVALLQETRQLARRHGRRQAEGAALSALGMIHTDAGEFDAAQERFQDALAISRELGDLTGALDATGNLAQIAAVAGDDARARELQLEVLAGRRELGIPVAVAVSLVNLAPIGIRQGDLHSAGRWLAECIELLRESGEQRVAAYAVEAAAGLAAALDQRDTAACLYGAAAALRERVAVPYTPGEERKILAALERVAATPSGQAALAQGRGLSLAEAMDRAHDLANFAGSSPDSCFRG